MNDIRYSLRAGLHQTLVKMHTLQDFLRGTKSYIHAFDARVSRLLAHPTMLVSYAARDLHVLTHIPTRNRFSVHEKLARESFHAIATSTRTITMRVNLRWRPPCAAHSTPMAVSTIDRPVYNHVTLNNVYCLEKSQFYCCTCLITWTINLPIHLLEFYFVILVKWIEGFISSPEERLK